MLWLCVSAAGWTVLHALASAAAAAGLTGAKDTPGQQPSGYWGCIKDTISRLIDVGCGLVADVAAAALADGQPLEAGKQQQMVSGWVLGVVDLEEPISSHYKGRRVMAEAKELARRKLQELPGLAG
jgi:hypothetical protein